MQDSPILLVHMYTHVMLHITWVSHVYVMDIIMVITCHNRNCLMMITFVSHAIICDVIKGNESDVTNIDFEL